MVDYSFTHIKPNIDVASMLAPLKHWLIHIPQKMLSRYPHLKKKQGCNETPAY